jgi:hypothetical protein
MRRFLHLLPLLLLVGCGQPKTKAPLTQGLPVSTNVWAQLSLAADSKQANKASADFLQWLEAMIQANPEARRNLAKLNEALGAIKDAGLGDLAKGDLKSVTVGATLPKNAALIGPSPADLQLVLILRGNFNPTRLAEFAKNNSLKQTEIGGAPTWGLVEVVGKIAKEKETSPDPFGFGLTAVDEHTLVIATPTVLTHAVAALQGKEASFIAPRLNVLDAYQDWQLLVVFSNRDLIDNAAAENSKGERTAPLVKAYLDALPHDHIVAITGERGDQSAFGLYGVNAATQESISYGASMSTSLAPKFVELAAKLVKFAAEDK